MYYKTKNKYVITEQGHVVKGKSEEKISPMVKKKKK